MKLNKKQEKIKAKILAGTHVLKIEFSLRCTEKVNSALRLISGRDFSGFAKFYGIDGSHRFNMLFDEEIKNRPIINMSEWFEESEETSESTKDFQGSREYDEKLLEDYFDFMNDNEMYGIQIKCFLNKRYPNEALLKRKAEIEAELKEINDKLKDNE
jgi:hypothetical protein